MSVERPGEMPSAQERIARTVARQAEEKKTHYVIHKHAAWLCLAGVTACGVMGGFLLGILATT